MKQSLEFNSPEQLIDPSAKVLILGAGGFTANSLYLPKLVDLGVTQDQLILVDPHQERLDKVQETYPEAQSFLDTDNAFQQLNENGEKISAVIISSNTAAHVDNIKSIANAAQAGMIDLSETIIWSEKPVAPPELFDEVMRLKKENPNLEISVGYILRFSEAAAQLNRYISENDLAIRSISWVYGKDRRGDTRPTQGVVSDELVHPLSVTDMILTSAFDQAVGIVEVHDSVIEHEDFVDKVVQDKARLKNDSFPENPASRARVKLGYSFKDDGRVVTIPVKIDTSFTFDKQHRHVEIHAVNPKGEQQMLELDFDAPIVVDGEDRRADTLKVNGETVLEWGGDKAKKQLELLLKGDESLVGLETETDFQRILRDVGKVALNPEGIIV